MQLFLPTITTPPLQGRTEGERDAAMPNVTHGIKAMIRTCCAEEPSEALADQLQAFLSLSRRIESLAVFLDKEI
jgi:hypothetical protein